MEYEIKQLKKKKRKILGIPIALFIIGILFIGGVSATLLSYFGLITSETIVEQSVLVDGADYTVTTTDTGQEHTLKNNAGTPVIVKFETIQAGHGAVDGNIEGITTTYVGTLELTKKNTVTWQPLEDKIEITYTLVGETFEFFGVPEGYTLIYYKDLVVGLDGRLENPQPAITITSDIGSLPQEDDANIDELADYCGEPDFYEHCKGAKLWVVLTSDITGNTLNWANMANYYYETDLMAYSANGNGEITLPANGGGINFKIINDFNTALKPDTYTITTKVVPG